MKFTIKTESPADALKQIAAEARRQTEGWANQSRQFKSRRAQRDDEVRAATLRAFAYFIDSIEVESPASGDQP